MKRIHFLVAGTLLAAAGPIAATSSQARDGRHGIAVGEYNPGIPHRHGGWSHGPWRHHHPFAFGFPVYGGVADVAEAAPVEECALVIRRVYVPGRGTVRRAVRICDGRID
jgi:hypothetical protein